MKLDRNLEWITSCNDDYNKGRPEPAIDNAGDLLDVAMLALDIIKQHPEAFTEYESRRVR